MQQGVLILLLLFLCSQFLCCLLSSQWDISHQYNSACRFYYWYCKNVHKINGINIFVVVVVAASAYIFPHCSFLFISLPTARFIEHKNENNISLHVWAYTYHLLYFIIINALKSRTLVVMEYKRMSKWMEWGTNFFVVLSFAVMIFIRFEVFCRISSRLLVNFA